MALEYGLRVEDVYLMDYVDVNERYRQAQKRWQEMGSCFGLLSKKMEKKKSNIMTLAEMDAMEDMKYGK